MIEEVFPRPALDGRYTLVRLIGHGGMGAVYEATDNRLRRRVAIKRLNALARASLEAPTRFLREAQITAGLRHPGILEIYDLAVDDDGVPAIVMELLDGDDLASQLHRRVVSFSNEETIELARQVASALGAAHETGVIHRDLKPSNIFLVRGPEGVRAKVVDFGVSKLLHQGDNVGTTRTGDVIGTPRYMSPEQIQSNRNLDARSDLFSLGAILYETVTGAPPFESETLPGLALQILQEPHAPAHEKRHEVSPGLSRLIDRCLAKRREDRPSTMKEFLAELEKVAKGLDPQRGVLRIFDKKNTTDVTTSSVHHAVSFEGSERRAGDITRLGQGKAPTGFFRADYFAESMFFENASARHKRIEETLSFYRDELRREYNQLDGQALQTHRLWLACVLLGFGVLIGGVIAMLIGKTTQGAAMTASSVLFFFVQRVFQQREDHYRSKAEAKHEHLRYGEQWLLAIQTIDALADPKLRVARAEKLVDAILTKMGPMAGAAASQRVS